jgi:hypothetical protein
MACNCSKRVRGGRQTNGFTTCSHGVLLGSSSRRLSITYSYVSWLCFGVAVTFAVRIGAYQTNRQWVLRGLVSGFIGLVLLIIPRMQLSNGLPFYMGLKERFRNKGFLRGFSFLA